MLAANITTCFLRSIQHARRSQRNLRQTRVWGHGYAYVDAVHSGQDNHAFYERMQRDVPACWGVEGRNIAAAGHFGEHDPCGKEAVGAPWSTALPTMKEATKVYPDIGHFVEEYKGPAIARSITSIAGIAPR